jgi:hypothetical protein
MNKFDAFDELLEEIKAGHSIQKVQTEREIAPILSIFLPEILDSINPENGTFEMISREFPLKQQGDAQSKNIVYLLINRSQKTLIMFELKTNPNDNRLKAQFDNYSSVKQRVLELTGKKLLEDIDEIINHTSYREKYITLKKRLDQYRSDIEEIREISIVYLVPNALKPNMDCLSPDLIITFDQLPISIEGKKNTAWSKVYELFQYLNKNSRRTTITTKNYGDTYNKSRHNLIYQMVNNNPDFNGHTPQHVREGKTGNTGANSNFQVYCDNNVIIPCSRGGKTYKYKNEIKPFKSSNLGPEILWEEFEKAAKVG